ncbi:MAG TPA: 6-phospho-beta-glucosidase, partial [Enterococcus sp.]|nr:6-phospho-beta-glucosidase [Enterococcus sp.]
MTLDREEALKDADFVTTQFRVGLLNARVKDERIPAYYGMIGQETNGPGGMFKAFRTIPIILDIVEDMKRLCPNAWLINFANPSGMVTEAIVRYGKWDKVIGLCNVPVMATMIEPALIGKEPDELIYKFAGLNHFHWHKVADNHGNDVTMDIIDKMYEEDNGLPKNIFDVPFYREQLEQMKMIPCGYHRYYYRQEEMLNHALEEYKTIGTRAQQVKQTEAELFELYKDPELDHKPEQLQKRGGAYYSDAACETIASIYANKNTQIVVSTKNEGAVPDLPADCVVEVTAYVGGQGARNVAFGELPTAEKGWLQVMKAMELLTIEAAVTGDYNTALQAFTINPLVPSGETAKRVMDELFIAHKAHLPNFKATIERLEKEGVEVQDEVARDLDRELVK